MRRRRVATELLGGAFRILRSNIMSAADGAKISVATSAHDAPGAPSANLVRLGLDAANEAQSIDFGPLLDRSADARRYLPVFPGEHYRLLAALVRVATPTNVLEIGTFTGLSSLAMLATLPPGGHVTTFDLKSWKEIPSSALLDEDMANGRLDQRLGDLSLDAVFSAHMHLITEADMIFIDGPKDDRFEGVFIDRLITTPRSRTAIVVLDDIRFPCMVGLWRAITLPKLDLTSFGHWSGTGIFVLPKRTE